MRIQPIVEGDGETEAVPELLRRLIQECQAYSLSVGRPIKQSRFKLCAEASLHTAVRVALKQPDCGAILILFDSDKDCPKDLAPRVESWARAAAGPVPCAVVMAHREYEAWFLATIESLRGRCGIMPDAESHPSPEEPRGAKEHLEGKMFPDRSYMPTTHQVKLTAAFDMGTAYRKCRSFRQMVKVFGELCCALGVAVGPWPPPTWK